MDGGQGERLTGGVASRVACARILQAVLRGRSLDDAFALHLGGLTDRDRAFASEVCYGTLRHRLLLGATLDGYLRQPLKPRHEACFCLLLSAFYQLALMHAKPHAVVNESVNACIALKFNELKNMVNAVLRGFVRDGTMLAECADLGTRYSYPEFMCRRLGRFLKGDELERVLAEGNNRAPMFLRAELSKTSTGACLEKLRESGIEASERTSCPGAIELASPCDVSELPLFAEGLVTVQDISAQMAAPLLPVSSGQRVLDCCCAPGGKSAHLLDLHPDIELYSLDADEKRLGMAADTLKRLGRSARLEVCDGRRLQELGVEFDAVLLDAPCSGTGVIRRHPDIKWLRKESDIDNLVKLQSDILESAFSSLKKDGFLLYTTCSLLQEENGTQMREFMARHTQDARPAEFGFCGKRCSSYQRLTGEDGGDGFFYALVQKV